MMASSPGKITASYLVRCALPAKDSITVTDYMHNAVTMPGEIGLAPQWKTGLCDTKCQELVSACLEALTNGSGAHIQLELSSGAPSIGLGHTSAYPYQEAAFYGNIFTSPPKAFFCIGKDFEGWYGLPWLAAPQRACAGYTALGIVACPYLNAGNCGGDYPSCRFGAPTAYVGVTASDCSTGVNTKSVYGANNVDFAWHNVITTYRASKTQ